jgi:hypothetical protein
MALGGLPELTWAGEESLPAARDATLIESAEGSLANGAGPHLFVGRTNQPEEGRRRALLWFDVGALPPGAVVSSARLVLEMSQSHAEPVPIGLHRVIGAWSEGAAYAEGGSGAPAGSGDATWLDGSYEAQPWAAPGGDFVETPSAVQTVAGPGVIAWHGPGLAQDVQRWLDDPASNQGWILIGDETRPGSVKRFTARENPDPTPTPRLEVVFGRRLGACADHDLASDALALCTAYCEALHCTDPSPRGATRACEQLAERFTSRTHTPVPCTIVDLDGDGVADEADNCPATPNPEQEDGDADGVGDACDNCPNQPNPEQEDGGGGLGVGDACDCPCFTSLSVATLVMTLQDPDTYSGLLCIDTREGKPLTAVIARRIDGTPCATGSPDCSALAVEFTEDNACQWNPPRPAPSRTLSGILDAQRNACREAIQAGATAQGLRCE